MDQFLLVWRYKYLILLPTICSHLVRSLLSQYLLGLMWTLHSTKYVTYPFNISQPIRKEQESGLDFTSYRSQSWLHSFSFLSQNNFFFVRSAICILQLKHSSSRETQNSVSQLFNHGLMFYGLAMPIFYFCLPFFLTHFCADESKLAQYVIYTADKLHSVING